ncbi:MAG: alpha-galactosidase [Lachnospiraceae bacterium]|nr:alpha-galactosidase [Lachnospiraceae bacterium]
MDRLMKIYDMGDMQCLYFQDEETGLVDSLLLPADMTFEMAEKEKPYMDSLIQLKLVGDTYTGSYAGGMTLRGSETVTGRFRYADQTVRVSEEEKTKEIITLFTDGQGHEAEHHYIYREGAKHVESFSRFRNNGAVKVTLELLSSFSMGKITPFTEGDAAGTLLLHRLRSVWSMEGRLVTDRIEDLQLEPSWGGGASRCERFGQVGSMPVNKFFPYMVIEDTRNDLFWGAQLAHNGSWQMEAYRRGDYLAISGGQADREFGHWMKDVAPGETYETPRALLSVCHGGGVGRISQRMTYALEPIVEAGPESEQDLPVIFNEYCTTWGVPSHENISKIVAAIADIGVSYFVIDCGWYKDTEHEWWNSMGDYEVSRELFPEGLQRTVDLINSYGMKAGIWFEMENVAPFSKAFQDEAHLLHRDGQVLTVGARRFLNMADPETQDILAHKVIDTLRDYHFEYMKIDYNETIGIGCDGAESLGEGLRKDRAASIDFLHRIKREVPGIILENCASGGHRLEPLSMSECSMASFSDAHECPEIPVIAASLHYAILPRQSQIWAVIRKSDTIKRITYTIAATFLGRMCLSGDVLDLSSEQWKAITDGIAFYKQIRDIIRHGYSYLHGSKQVSWRHLTGWQCLLRVGVDAMTVASPAGNGRAVAIFHTFANAGTEPVCVELPEGHTYQIDAVYSDHDSNIHIEDGKLYYTPTADWQAAAVLMQDHDA